MSPAVDLPSVYIDGQSGTVGLRIRSMLAGRQDLSILEIDPAQRRNPEARKRLLEGADVAILCLPDDAARQAVSIAIEGSTRFIDGSTAHRVADGWVYGLPELCPGQRDAVRSARYVTNPGCYPTGVALALRPLVERGLLAADSPVVVHALSGYTGGGKALVDKWEDAGGGLCGLPFEVPYSMHRAHKHLPEMQRYSALAQRPLFVPAVGAFACGMRIQIPLHSAGLSAGVTSEAVRRAWQDWYRDEPAIAVRDAAAVVEAGEFGLDPRRCNGLNLVELVAVPHPDGHLLLIATLDNLGKGAAGAAVQNLNLMLGLPEWTGLNLTPGAHSA